MSRSLHAQVLGSLLLLAAAGCGGSAKPAASTAAAPPPKVRPLPMVVYQPTAAKDEWREQQELTPDNVVDIILSKYKTGLERCHQELLVREPKADGKVALSFTVDAGGHVLTPKVKGFDAGIDNCIAQRATAWTFPPPKGKEGEPTSAAFEVTLKLDGQ